MNEVRPPLRYDTSTTVGARGAEVQVTKGNIGRPPATAIYDSRAFMLGALSLDVAYEEIQKLPVAPFSHPLSDENALRYQACLYAIGALRSATEVGTAAQIGWFAGKFLAASVLIRVFVELWGAGAYVEQKVLRKIEAGEIATAATRMRKLLLGSKTGVSFRPDVEGEKSVVNVMEFVRAAAVIRPGVEDDYIFLCDAAHPAYVPNTHLLFAGAVYDNWSNEAFAKAMHPTLDRTLSIAETALEGLRDVSMEIFARCIPSIVDEASQWPSGDEVAVSPG